MTKARWRRMWTAFHHARTLPEPQRAQWAEQDLADDPQLQQEVLALLSVPHHAERQPISPDTLEQLLRDVSPTRLLNTSIGPYKLLEVLGEGGMGVVYAAQQSQPLTRKVAIKIIKIGMDTHEVVARFESERQALAMMDHPNIAKVLDAGATDSGRPYFVMDFVDGIPLTEYCRTKGLTLRQRLELFLEVLGGIQHAHQKGIIHRDLKPSNILINRDGKPIIIDFGLVKALTGPLSDVAHNTVQGRVMGTPAYMSPEQAEQIGTKVDTRSDLYSLGVILYELLTGSRPYDGIIDDAEFQNLAHLLATHDPQKPSQRLHQGDRGPSPIAEKIPADIDWIVLKAMAKIASARYANAQDFANDIRCFLAFRPVSAGPPSARYRLAKFVRRHRMSVTLGALCILGVVLALAGLGIGLIQAQKAHKLAAAEQQKAQQVNRFLLTVLSGASPYIAKGADTTILRNMLDAASQRIDAQLSDQPLLAAEVHDQLAEINREVGFYDVALVHAERAYALRNHYLGADDILTLRTHTLLGLVLWDLGDLNRSVEILERNLDGLKRVAGPTHLDTLSAQGNLALTLKAQRRIDQAEGYYRDLIDKAKTTLGLDARLTLLYQANYAALLRDSNRVEEAEPLIADSATQALEKFGSNDPDAIIWHDIWGDVLIRQGRLAEAERIQNVAMTNAEATFGADHQTTIGVTATRAKILSRLGRHTEAQDIYRSALVVLRGAFGTQHRYTLSIMRDLGSSLRLSGQLREALAMLRELVETNETALPKDHPTRLRATIEYGLVLIALKRPDEGIKILTDAYPIALSVVGPSHELLIEVKQRLAVLNVEI